MIRRALERHAPVGASMAALALAFGLGAARYPHFASWRVVRNLVVDNSFLGIAAVGASFVIIAGGIDLSVGAVVAFTGVFIATAVDAQALHPAAAMVAAVALATGFGAAQGWLIHAFRLPAFLVTLAGMFLARGAAFVVSPASVGVRHGFVARTLNEACSIRVPLGERGIVVPLVADLFVLAAIVGGVVLGWTRLGRAIRAVGDDEGSASLMGVDVGRTRVAAYAIGGFGAGLAGVAYLLYQQSGDPAACKGFELDVIAGVVMGGTLLRGGAGSVVGTVVGVLLFGVVQTLLTFEGTLSSWWSRIAVGALVLAFVLLQRGVTASARARER